MDPKGNNKNPVIIHDKRQNADNMVKEETQWVSGFTPEWFVTLAFWETPSRSTACWALAQVELKWKGDILSILHAKDFASHTLLCISKYEIDGGGGVHVLFSFNRICR